MLKNITAQQQQRYLIALFFAGLGCCFGISLQALAFYSTCLLIPAIICLKNPCNPRIQGALRTLGLCLLCMYLVFPLTNIISYLISDFSIGNQTFSLPETFRTSKLFSSKFSSAFGVSGAMLLALSVRRKQPEPLASTSNFAIPALNIFARGLLTGLIILFFYAGLQHFFGLSIQAPLGMKDLMINGRFRASGFYGHPLTLASLALTWFVFFYVHLLHCKYYLTHNKSLVHSLLIQSSAICIFSVALLVFSGARASIAIAGLLILLCPLLFIRTTQMNPKSLLGLWATAASMIVGTLYFSGIWRRFAENQFNFTNTDGMLGQRINFWKVHWQAFLDKPWLGHGSSLFDSFMRQEYYTAMGLADAEQKYNAHNIFLEILCSTGVLGFAIIGSALLIFVKTLYGLTRHSQQDQLMFRAFVVTLLANVVHGLTQNTFFDSSLMYGYLMLLWLMLWNLKGPRTNYA